MAKERKQRAATVETDSSSFSDELSSASVSLSVDESESAATVTESSDSQWFMTRRLQNGLYKYFPMIGYHHVLMMIVSISFLFLCGFFLFQCP